MGLDITSQQMMMMMMFQPLVFFFYIKKIGNLYPSLGEIDQDRRSPFDSLVAVAVIMLSEEQDEMDE